MKFLAMRITNKTFLYILNIEIENVQNIFM